MPIGVFKTIREVSSEDKVHLAENLIKQVPGKKWKTKTVGEKSAYVILEFDESQQIAGIDIGNEHAAFIEVLVSKSGCSSDDFHEILITSSFMTPIESKNSSNINRVRCFNKDAFVPSTLDNKWKLLKVICMQPFNRHVQYGLSFIKVHVVGQTVENTKSKSLVPEKYLKQQQFSDTKATTTSSSTEPKPFTSMLGNFKLREDSPDSESESTTALFKRWKTSRNNSMVGDTAQSTAASIREASKPAEVRRLSVSKSSIKRQANNSIIVKTNEKQNNDDENNEEIAPKILDRNRERLLFGDDGDDDDSTGNVDVAASAEEQKRRRLSKQIELDKERLRQENEKLKKDKESKKDKEKHKRLSSTVTSSTVEKVKTTPKTTELNQTAVKSHSQLSEPQERASKRLSSPGISSSATPAKKKKATNNTSFTHTAQYRPFNKLLSNVVFVISGIQNPDRANLRSKAQALGARYKPDWENGCTHLICAFKNTPKYNQVKACNGKIVTRSWIEKCHALKKYLPWRRYAMDSTEVAKLESDEEILDESLKPQATTTVELDSSDNGDDDDGVAAVVSVHEQEIQTNNTLANYELDDRNVAMQNDNSADADTDDELERIAQENKVNKKISAAISNKSKSNDIFEVTTEEEDFLQDKKKKEKLFFSNLHFHICSDISAVENIKLEKFIKKYGGQLTSDIAKAKFAISEKSLSQSNGVNVPVVRPLWIYECSDMEVRVSEKRYLVSS